MKKILFTIAFLFSLGLFAQSFEVEEIQVDSGNNMYQGTFKFFKPILVFEIAGTPEELYNSILNWVNKTYIYSGNNSLKDLTGNLEGKYVSFNSVVPNLISKNVLSTIFTYDVRYSIEIKFKENKLRYEVTKMEWFSDSPEPASSIFYENKFGRWNEISFGFRTTNKKGKANKKTGIRKPGKPDKIGIGNFKKVKYYFESLGMELKEYIEKDISSESDDDDW